MKIKKNKLKEIIKEEVEKVFTDTSLMEDMFTEEEKKHWLQEFQKSEKDPSYELELKAPIESFVNALLLADATGYKREAALSEEEEGRGKDILSMISSDQWQEVGDDNEALAREFYESVGSNPRLEFLTLYSLDDLKEMRLFKLPGYNIGFAIKSDGDIVSVHNSERTVRGVGKALVEAAKRNGGSKLDHFDGFLSPFYESLGFREYERWTWNDEYAPKGWSYEQYGTPDVVLRKLGG